MFTAYGWQRLCTAVKTPVAIAGRNSSMATWRSKHLMEVLLSFCASLHSRSSDKQACYWSYRMALKRLWFMAVACGASIVILQTTFSWYVVVTAGTGALLLLRGVYIPFQGFGVIGTWNWRNGKGNRETFPLRVKDRTLDALKQLSEQMIFYLALCVGSSLVYSRVYRSQAWRFERSRASSFPMHFDKL